MLSNTKNIILDLGGVIINLDINQTINAFLKIAKKPNLISLNNPLFSNFETGNISTTHFIEKLSELTNVNTKNIVPYWNKMLLDIPKKRIDLIQQLSNQYNVYLLSNTNSIHLAYINQYLKNHYNINKLDSLFTKAYYSHQVGMAKPAANIFNYVLKDANILAHETLFIDDTLQHVESAKKIGINAIHLDLNKQDIIQLFNEY